MELIQFFTFSFCKKIGNRTDGKVFGDGTEVEREDGGVSDLQTKNV